MKYAILTNDKGISVLGSDGIVPLDGRWNLETIKKNVQEYRERYKKNFLHKYEYWTHFGIVNGLKHDPTTTHKI